MKIKRYNEILNESKNNFDFLEVVDWLEYATDWGYVEYEGQNRIRYDWPGDMYSMWLNDDGTIEGRIPKDIKEELLSKGVTITK